MSFIRFPYTDAHQLNLDWIIKKIQDLPTKLSQLINDTGFVNAQQAAAAAPVQSVNGQTGNVIVGGGGGGNVVSVNGQTGVVVLDAADVGALPDNYTAPVQSVNGQTGAVVLSIPDDTSDLTNSAGFVTAAQAAAAAPVQSVNGMTGNVIVGGGGGGDVVSVNGQTGVVVLDADDVGALPDTYTAPVQSVNGQTGAVSISIPTNTNQLTNGAGFVDSAGAASAAPVQSVNGQTGAVSISIPTNTNQLTNGAGFVTAAQAAAAAPVQSVNGQTGTVILDADDIGAAAPPEVGSISLSSNWTGSSSPYTQTVTVTGATVTSNSKVDLQPNASVIAQMISDSCMALFIENNNGTLTAYAVGSAPTTALTIQATVTEVSV